MRKYWVIIGIWAIGNGLLADGLLADGLLADGLLADEVVADEVVADEAEEIVLDSVRLQVNANDTFYSARMQDVWVYPTMVFTSKKQERFYWRTVRDVKKTLPYAKLLSKEMQIADQQLALLPDEKARRKWWKQYEKFLFKKYEKAFRRMTASQGQMLMKLMDRESDRTSYEIIQHYRGKASANFWQFVAKLFKNDLKEEYDAKDKDRIVERVINLVEAGQL